MLNVLFQFSSTEFVGRPIGKKFETISSYGFFASNGAIIARRLFEVMGRYSELLRPDRDIYVRINWHNIFPGNLIKYHFL